MKRHQSLVWVLVGCVAANACGEVEDPSFTPLDASPDGGGAGASGSCASSDDCAPRGLVCLVDEGRCVECLSRAGCQAGSECVNNVCRPEGTGGTGGDSVGGSAGVGPMGASGTGTLDASADAGGTGGSGGSGDAGCDPLDILLLFDSSGSMGAGAGDAGSTKFSSAVSSFLAWAQTTQNVRVALQLHPVTSSTPLPPTCTTSAECGPGGLCLPPIGCIATGQPSCDASLYQTPRVPLSPLPSSRDAFVTALNVMPSGGSPLGPALEGGLVQARALAGAHPTGTTIVVLVADGPDNSCSGADAGDAWGPLVARAAAALGGSPSIKTHVIAISSTLDGFDRVARAGGTTVFGAPSGDLGQALTAIEAAYPCP